MAEKINQTEVLDKFVDYVKFLEKKENLSEDDRQKLIVWLKVLEDVLDWEEKLVLQNLIQQLENKNNLSIEQFRKIDTIVSDFKKRNIELNRAELLKLKEVVENTRWFKKDLIRLRQNISLTSEKLERLQDLKTKLIDYIKKYHNFQKKYPIWSKVVLKFLPPSVLWLFLSRQESNDEYITWFWKVIWEIKKFFENIVIFIYSLFFDLFAPKEVKQWLTQVRQYFNNLSQEDISLLKDLLQKDERYTDILKYFNKEDWWLETDNLFFKENIEQYKEVLINTLMKKLTFLLNITSKEDKNKLKDWLEQRWQYIKQRGKPLKQDFLEKLSEWKLDELSISDIFEGIWLGVVSVYKLTTILCKKWLITPWQIIIKTSKSVVEWSYQIVLESISFFPKVFWYVLFNWWSLKDLYDFVDLNKLSEEEKTLFLVGIYRFLISDIWDILSHIGAAPFYLLSSAASIGEDVTKFKLFTESLRFNQIEKQLKVLSEIENKLLGLPLQQWWIYKHILTALLEYKKWIAVSWAYHNAKDYSQFKKLLENIGYSTDRDIVHNIFEEIKKSKLENSFKWDEVRHIVGKYIDKLSAGIKRIDDDFWRWFKELIYQKLWPYFWKTNLFKFSISTLADSLRFNADIIEAWEISKFWQKRKSKFKFSYETTNLTDIRDVVHFQGNLNDLKDFFKDLKIIAKESPQLARYIFRTMPIWIVSSDIIDAFKKWEGVEEIVKVLTMFIPFVGPVVFLGEDIIKTNGEISLTKAGVAGVWISLDAWYFLRNVRKFDDILRYSFQPIEDIVKWVSTGVLYWYRIIWGRIVSMNSSLWKVWPEVQKFIEFFKRWRVKKAFRYAVAILLMFLTAKEWIELFGKYVVWKEAKLLQDLARLSKQGERAVNEYIFKNWNSFSKEERESLILAYISYYMNLTPEEIWEFIDDVKIKIDEKSGKQIVNIVFTDTWRNSEYLKRKFMKNTFRLKYLADKLNLVIKDNLLI